MPTHNIILKPELHIMLDLETWGRTPGSDIRSIGAVAFDPVAGLVVRPGRKPDFGYDKPTQHHFYTAVDNPKREHGRFAGVSDHRKYNLTREQDTVDWWARQSKEAQSAFANPVDLWTACFAFANWCREVAGVPGSTEPLNTPLWANDPDFDVSILEAVFKEVGVKWPFHYRSPRSMRTAVALAGMDRSEFACFGDAHHALDDATAQAMTVMLAHFRLGLNNRVTVV